VLVPEQRPVPKPGPGEILIKVAAAGVNRPDVLPAPGHSIRCRRKARPIFPDSRSAGEVAAHRRRRHASCKVGRQGDVRWSSGGGYAEYCLAHENSRAAGAAID
jgi:NADPH2:quinone reductase